MSDIQKSVTNPSKPEYFELNRGDYRDHLAEKLTDTDMVVLTDGDADGIFSAGLVEHVFGDSLSVTIVPCGVHDNFIYLNDALRVLNENLREDTIIWILDICLNEYEDWKMNNLEKANEKFTINFFDHHEWSNTDKVNYVKANTSYMELDGKQDHTWEYKGNTFVERPTVLMLYQYFNENNVEFSDSLIDRIKAVAVGDVWATDTNNEYIHPLTQDLVYAVEYVTNIPRINRKDQKWYGYQELITSFLDTTTELKNTQLKKFAEKYDELVKDKTEFIFNNEAEYITKQTVDGITYMVLYGNTPATETAKIAKEHGADVVSIVYPSIGAAFRGKKDVFENCHKIAEEFNGGGHKMASGCSLKQVNPYPDREQFIEDKGKQIRELLIEKLIQHT